MHCPKCDAVNSDDSDFCKKCGGRLQHSEGEPSTAPAAAVPPQGASLRPPGYGASVASGLLVLVGIGFEVLSVVVSMSGPRGFDPLYDPTLRNSGSIALLVLGIAVWLLGLILGHVGRRMPRRTPGRGWSVTALIIGYVLVAIHVLVGGLALLGDQMRQSFEITPGSALQGESDDAHRVGAPRDNKPATPGDRLKRDGQPEPRRDRRP